MERATVTSNVQYAYEIPVGTISSSSLGGSSSSSSSSTVVSNSLVHGHMASIGANNLGLHPGPGLVPPPPNATAPSPNMTMAPPPPHASNMNNVQGGMGCNTPASIPADENYCLRWNDYEKKHAESFRGLREDDYFSDVTLVAESYSVKAHRVILSSCSNYFHAILKNMNPWHHPVILLHDVRSTELNSLMDFIYLGQASVSHESLQYFLKVAQKLKIKGLYAENSLSPPTIVNEVVPPSNTHCSPIPVVRKEILTQTNSTPGGIPVSGGNFDGLLPRSTYIPEPSVVPLSQTPTNSSVNSPGIRTVSSAPPLAHQSPRQTRSTAGHHQPPTRVATEPLVHYTTPKRAKYTSLSPQSILRTHLQYKDHGSNDHVEVKSEPMNILAAQEDVPSSGVNVTEFITTHENDLNLQTLGHAIQTQYLFSTDPNDNSGQGVASQGGHNGPPPPTATVAMVNLDEKGNVGPTHANNLTTLTTNLNPGNSASSSTSSIHHATHPHQHSHSATHQGQHHHHDEPQDLTPGPQDPMSGMPQTPNNGGSMHSTPNATPTSMSGPGASGGPTTSSASAANNSANASLVVSPSPTPPKKDRNSRKTCGYCHKDFHEMSLKRHIKDVHLRSQNTCVICPQCCKQYASQNSLYSHLNRVHGVKKDMMPSDLIQMNPTSASQASNTTNTGPTQTAGTHSNNTGGNNTPTPADNHHDGVMDLAQHSDNSN